METKDADMNGEEHKDLEVVEDAGIEYTSLPDLTEVEASDESVAKIIGRLSSEDWKENFYGLDDLRSLYKFHPVEFEAYLPKFAELVKDGINNLRSSICRNALNLASEVFATDKNLRDLDESGEASPFGEFWEAVLPPIARRVADDKVFLSSKAVKATELIAEHWVSKGITEQFWELSKSKSLIIASQANNALKTNCQKMESEFWKEKENIEPLLKIVSQDLISKRQPFTKNSKLIMKSLKEKLGEAELKVIAKDALGSDEEVNKIMKAFLIKKEKDSSKGFRDFLKKKKSAKQKKDGTPVMALKDHN